MQQKNIPFERSDYVLAKNFREAGERQGWLHDEAVAVAVSGGGDSIALLMMCRKFFGGRVVAVHVNHGIRGRESDGDEAFTREFAQSIGAEFVCVRADVPGERTKGESLESAARRIRLSHLCTTAHAHNIRSVLLGHNRDDLAETVLFNILRGTGIRGAVGMTECTTHSGINFYRPLLGMRREFLRDVLRVRGLTWREDSTNTDDRYTRNYIRLKLLPLIEDSINTSAVEHLANFGEDMRQVREQEDAHSRTLLNDCRNDDDTLDRKKLRALDDNERALVIREIGRKRELKTLSRGRCCELSGLMAKPENFVFQWVMGFTVRGVRGKVFFVDERGVNNQ